MTKDASFKKVVRRHAAETGQRYTEAMIAQLAQSAACNAVHTLSQRCARWLLQTHDRVRNNQFPLTQAFLGGMLGVRRAGVSEAASRLSKAGLIRYQRGVVQVLDRAGLEHASCECYRATQEALERILGPDPRDPASASVAADDATRSLREGVRGLRLGVPSNYFFDRIHRSVGSAVERALNVLEDMGAVRVAVEIPHVELSVPIGIGILMPEASAVHQSWIRQQPSRYDDGTRRMLEAGELVLATDYLRAQRARSVIKDEFKRTFQNHRLDALITPTEPTAATRIDQMSVDFGADELEPFFSVFVRQTIPFNVSGLPALSVPCGFSEGNEGGRIGVGLPIGLHIAGRPFDEATVLRIGFAYESATAWHTRRPPI